MCDVLQAIAHAKSTEHDPGRAEKQLRIFALFALAANLQKTMSTHIRSAHARAAYRVSNGSVIHALD